MIGSHFNISVLDKFVSFVGCFFFIQFVSVFVTSFLEHQKQEQKEKKIIKCEQKKTNLVLQYNWIRLTKWHNSPKARTFNR